jgi:hypothetical protein
MSSNYLERFPELKIFLHDLEERFLRSHLPPDKIILDDYDVMKMLKISKRKLADMRAKRQIKFHPTGKKPAEFKAYLNGKYFIVKGSRGGKNYYTLQGVMDYVESITVNPLSNQVNL